MFNFSRLWAGKLFIDLDQTVNVNRLLTLSGSLFCFIRMPSFFDIFTLLI